MPSTGEEDMTCNTPHLGLATTRELLDELRARIEMHALGGLDYRTVDGEKFARGAMPSVKTPATIAELDALLNSEDGAPITINPDGSITETPLKSQ
jgi:hypothetical protein